MAESHRTDRLRRSAGGRAQRTRQDRLPSDRHSYIYVRSPRDRVGVVVRRDRSPRQLAAELRELWTLMVTRELPRSEGLSPVRLALLTSAPHASGDEATAAAARALAAYRAFAREPWPARLTTQLREIWEADDEEPHTGFMRGLQAGRHWALNLCTLPPSRTNGRCAQRLGAAELVLVVEGRLTLTTIELRQELRQGDAAALLPHEESVRELVNHSDGCVRFLTFSPVLRGLALGEDADSVRSALAPEE